MSTASPVAAPVDADRVLDYLRGQRQPFVSFLERLTLSESPSSEPRAHDGIRDVLAEAFHGLGYACIKIHGRRTGGHLYARRPDRPSGQPTQLVLGHFDTVWPVGTLDEMPFALEGNVVRGPGVYDMKGGITQVVFALKALEELGIEPRVSPVVLLNSDEEIGSRESGRYIARLARCVERVFVLEPSLGAGGRLKTARKGVGRFHVTIKGKAAHAGLDPTSGASAILELSHVIQSLFALNDPEKGITVNVGMVDGGLRPNVVAPQSAAVVDMRVPTQADAERVERAIRSLAPTTPVVSLEVDGRMGRAPMEATGRNQALWQLAHDLGRRLGLALEQGTAGGGSDGSTTSAFTATLDGLGAVGDGAHAEHEHLVLDKTIERAALLALLLAAPPLFQRPPPTAGPASTGVDRGATAGGRR